jgi:hypothetical protein
MQINSFSDWLEYMLKISTDECMQIIASITYNIWLARNLSVFQGKGVHPTNMVHQAIKTLHEYQSNQAVDNIPTYVRCVVTTSIGIPLPRTA